MKLRGWLSGQGVLAVQLGACTVGGARREKREEEGQSRERSGCSDCGEKTDESSGVCEAKRDAVF